LSGVLLPPPQYDKPYTGQLNIATIPYWNMGNVCNMIAPQGQHMEACSFAMTPQQCLVYLPRLSDVGQSRLADLTKHEIAHCNGWPGNHPGAHF
jgi:hypothetical protein